MKMQTRQTQSVTQGLQQGLTMTPQLVQSIKLLQMSSLDLLKHIEEQIERNPLLELADGESRIEREDRQRSDEEFNGDNKNALEEPVVTGELDISQARLEDNLDTSFENEFDGDRSGGETSGRDQSVTDVGSGFDRPSTGTDFSRAASPDVGFEEYVPQQKNLRDHLYEQLAMTRAGPAIRLSAGTIIDNLDDDGYFRGRLQEIAVDRNIGLSEVEASLELVQGFDPIGIAARDLAECLKLQLIEKNRYDPAIAGLLQNLDLLARRDFDSLVERCGVSFDDVLDMVDEVRALDPRPARRFDTTPAQTVIADVFVKERPDGSFAIELNPDALPKVLINQTYQAIVASGGDARSNKFITDCLSDANWLVRSLEQRAQTILKVMVEIVRQQDGFFVNGVSHLRPMSLKQVADAVEMHESTISRVTSNKYVLTTRGMFELKFFFTASLASTDGSEAHSAEAVRQKIRKLIDDERVDKVLSDDAIVELLCAEGVEIARRTVAKYREAMNIASSVQRRREKKALATRRS